MRSGTKERDDGLPRFVCFLFELIDFLIIFILVVSMSDTKQRFFNLLEILSFRAARLLVTFEHYMPSFLKPKRALNLMKERNEFIRQLIQQELQENYSFEEILWCRNIINANDISKMEMGVSVDLQAAIHRFKLAHPTHSYIQDINVLSLLPYRTRCSNIRNGTECGEQLRVDFHMTALVVYPTTIQPCTLYSGDCKKCQRSYRISSIYCLNEKKFIVTPEALAKNQYFHLSSGKLVYSRELLVSFSSDLVNGHITFHGAAASLLSKVSRLRSELGIKLDAVQLARSLEAHWIYFELFNFIFMASMETQIVAPRALFSGEISKFLNSSFTHLDAILIDKIIRNFISLSSNNNQYVQIIRDMFSPDFTCFSF